MSPDSSAVTSHLDLRYPPHLLQMYVIVPPMDLLECLEPQTRIELVYPAWKAGSLPLGDWGVGATNEVRTRVPALKEP